MSVQDPADHDIRPTEEARVPAPDRSTKIPHLVMALLFLGTVAVWALVVTGSLPPAALPYALPTLLVGAGVAGLVAVVLGSRGRRDGATDEKTDPQPDEWSDHAASDHDPQTLPLYRDEEYR